MNELLVNIIDAHGGTERWHWYEKVEATILSGGGFFALKGVPQDANPRHMTVWLHEERSSVSPYGAPDQRTMFTPERIAIEKLDGTMVAQRYAPRDSFAGHQMNTPLDPLHRAYANSPRRPRGPSRRPRQDRAASSRARRAAERGWPPSRLGLLLLDRARLLPAPAVRRSPYLLPSYARRAGNVRR